MRDRIRAFSIGALLAVTSHYPSAAYAQSEDINGLAKSIVAATIEQARAVGDIQSGPILVDSTTFSSRLRGDRSSSFQAQAIVSDLVDGQIVSNSEEARICEYGLVRNCRIAANGMFLRLDSIQIQYDVATVVVHYEFNLPVNARRSPSLGFVDVKLVLQKSPQGWSTVSTSIARRS